MPARSTRASSEMRAQSQLQSYQLRRRFGVVSIMALTCGAKSPWIGGLLRSKALALTRLVR
jgi:hypothetical protein